MGVMVSLSSPSLSTFLYGDNSNMVTNYLHNQIANMPKAFNEYGERMWNTLRRSYDYVTDRTNRMRIQSELSNNNLQVTGNHFTTYYDLQQLKQANPVMQRWIMAHPVVKGYYDNQDLDGYSDTYTNFSGKGAGHEDYNYRRVMDGVVQFNEDHMRIDHYYEDLLPGDEELEWDQRLHILQTWDTMDFILSRSKVDFTSTDDEAEINRHKPK